MKLHSWTYFGALAEVVWAEHEWAEDDLEVRSSPPDRPTSFSAHVLVVVMAQVRLEDFAVRAVLEAAALFHHEAGLRDKEGMGSL